MSCPTQAQTREDHRRELARSSLSQPPCSGLPLTRALGRVSGAVTKFEPEDSAGFPWLVIMASRSPLSPEKDSFSSGQQHRGPVLRGPLCADFGAKQRSFKMYLLLISPRDHICISSFRAPSGCRSMELLFSWVLGGPGSILTQGKLLWIR